LLNIFSTKNAFGATPMKVLSSRTQVDQPFVQASVVGGKEHVFVGGNDFAAPMGRTATIDLSRNACATNPAFLKARIETRNTPERSADSPHESSRWNGLCRVLRLAGL
jgi:hypothetical protein